MARQAIDISGHTFGRLTVVERAGKRASGNIIWLCVCSCGGQTRATVHALRKGEIVSCGCYRRDRVTKHGMRYSKIYAVWGAMIARCHTPTRKDYKWYGAKGTYVCKEWHAFPAFLKWSRESGYAEGLTIERKDVEGHYTPENCCWIPLKEQNLNKRSVVRWRHGTMTGYAKYRCRCGLCKAANAEASRNQRTKRAALKAEAKGGGR